MDSYKTNWSWTNHTESWVRVQAEGTVLNIPCGKSKLGIRADIDRQFNPDIICDLYHLPFRENCIDTVVSDPPFTFYGKGKKWFWTKLADVAKHKLILSTPLRNIRGVKGRRSCFL